MRTIDVSGSIQIPSSAGFSAKNGDVLHVSVVKRLFGNKWAVAVGGRVFSAVSQLDLKQGQKIRVIVHRLGRQIVLQTQSATDLELNDSIGVPGLRYNAELELMTESLSRSNLAAPLPELANLLSIFRRIGRKFKLRGGKKHRKYASRVSRSLALIFEKKLNLRSRQVDELVKILALLQNGAEDPRETKCFPESNRALREKLRHQLNKTVAPENDGHLLQLFNHVAATDETWIVVPLHFSTNSSDYSGIVKLLYNHPKSWIRKLVFEISVGDELWSFVFTHKNKKLKLKLFCDRDRLLKSEFAKIYKLISNLRNQGVECDDSIYDGCQFDGFSGRMEDLSRRVVDTYS